MPSFFGAVGRTSATLFEIRLDSDVLVLRGAESESSSQLLKGTVVLCLPASLKIEDVHMRMTGSLKVGWTDQRVTPTGISTVKVGPPESTIFTHKWPPFVGGTGPGSSSRGTTLPAGNYEWPFELVIPGSMAESVEGLNDSHIVYKLKATVARGKLAYDLHAWKPIRIVRTLDPSALELAHAMTVENVWPNKIEYSLVIPRKAIIFGTEIEVEMRFTSLLKGLKIGAIKCQLTEQQEFTIPGVPGHTTEKFWKHSRDVDSWTFELNEEEHYHDLLNESGQDGYCITEKMPLPKRLSRCLQDVDVHGIKIRHKVKFNVSLHNPDGHVSELRATLPVTIFISPNMPLTEQGTLVDMTPSNTQSVDIQAHAPPLYGLHVLDQLYADMDQAGLMTPAPQSGMNTPFNGLSRQGSSEDMAATSQFVSSSYESTDPSGVPPAALSSRLHSLNMSSSSRNSSFLRRHPLSSSGGNTPHYLPNETDGGYFDGASPSHSTTLSRRTSEEDEDGVTINHRSNGNTNGNVQSNLTSGQHTPEHIDYSDLGDLSKVPSYQTAVRAPIRGMSYSDALPNYDAAVSTPPSPERGFSTPVGGAITPLRNVSGNGHAGENEDRLGGSPARNPLASIGFTPISGSQPHGGDNDERRRLHLLQHRDRAH